ncbi:MAG: tRNA (adenosine(37)-N6)-dimethylallyltransferase MiaA [Pseudomonadales bacterium]
MAEDRPVLLLMGPTASGKTALAMALADRLPVALINMDSAQVYRGLDIGSAKPDAAELARYPHALLDVRDPAEPYSAADFVSDADALVSAAWDAGRLPVLVGGTMLYGRAFLDGLADLPEASPEVRAAIAARAKASGWPALHAELAERDPQAAAGIHPNNHQRLQRALEVLAVTGEPLSTLWRTRSGQAATLRLGAQVFSSGLLVSDRALLHRQIEARFANMLRSGLLEEVAALRQRDDLHLNLPAMRAVGYRQVWQHLDGDFGFDELLEKGCAATRQLAKRQLTWLRGWPQLIELEIDSLLLAQTSAARERVLGGLAETLLQHLAKSLDALHSRF